MHHLGDLKRLQVNEETLTAEQTALLEQLEKQDAILNELIHLASTLQEYYVFARDLFGGKADFFMVCPLLLL